MLSLQVKICTSRKIIVDSWFEYIYLAHIHWLDASAIAAPSGVNPAVQSWQLMQTCHPQRAASELGMSSH